MVDSHYIYMHEKLHTFLHIKNIITQTVFNHLNAKGSILFKCSRCHGLGKVTFPKTVVGGKQGVGGKQRHATCKILSLQQIQFFVS